MSPTELGVLTELAAVRYLLSEAGQEDLLETLGPQDRSKILDQAGIRAEDARGAARGAAQGGLRPPRRVLRAHLRRRQQPAARDARGEPRAHRGAC